MKLFFIDVGMTHYYNRILDRLDNLPGVELHLVIPAATSDHVGKGVHQTEEGVSFRVHRLPEYTRFSFYSSFKGLAGLLSTERPDVVIVDIFHVFTFVFNGPVIRAMERTGAKLLLHNIPFQLLKFDDMKRSKEIRGFARLPGWLARFLRGIGIERLCRVWYAYLMKHVFNLPDAHLVYIDEAYDIYGSYGVPRDCIFLTGNSPDTDLLFEIRGAIEKEPTILPANGYRLIHVGRLVEWKRVDMLIRAVARLKPAFPEVELLVAGFGPQEEELKKLAVSSGVETSIRFLGGVYDPAELGRYFLSSSIYVLAGMGGLSINDAMCFGLPVICSVCDGTEKRLVREDYSGKYFREGDEEDLAAKIAWMFDHPEERRIMGENAARIIREEMNIHTVIKGYTDAFAFVGRSAGECG